jgi:ClpP class serine protease
MFAGDVAKHRGTTLAAVKAGFGEGRSISAKQALAAGMIDRIATLEDVLGELTGAPRMRAEARGARAYGAAAWAPTACRINGRSPTRRPRDRAHHTPPFIRRRRGPGALPE